MQIQTYYTYFCRLKYMLWKNTNGLKTITVTKEDMPY